MSGRGPSSAVPLFLLLLFFFCELLWISVDNVNLPSACAARRSPAREAGRKNPVSLGTRFLRRPAAVGSARLFEARVRLTLQPMVHEPLLRLRMGLHEAGVAR